VISEQFALAEKQSVPFNIVMCIFVVTLCVPHWVFFYTYFECCTTMPYFYLRKKVPRWLKYGLKGLNVVMIIAQTVAPILVFTYA